MVNFILFTEILYLRTLPKQKYRLKTDNQTIE